MYPQSRVVSVRVGEDHYSGKVTTRTSVGVAAHQAGRGDVRRQDERAEDLVQPRFLRSLLLLNRLLLIGGLVRVSDAKDRV